MPEKATAAQRFAGLLVLLAIIHIPLAACGAHKAVAPSPTPGSSSIPGSPEAFLQRGDVYASGQEWEQAIRQYDQAIHLKPDYAEAYNNRGYAYYWKGSAEQAIADLSKAIELRPNYPFAYNSRGAAYMAGGHPRQAIPDLNRAIELEPDFPQAYTNRGNAYLRLGRLDLALADLGVKNPIRTLVLLCGALIVLILSVAWAVFSVWRKRRRRAYSNSVRITSLMILLIIMVFSTTLAPIIALRYSYNTASRAVSGVGLLILLAASVFLWLYGRRMSHAGDVTGINRAIKAGIALGLLWVVEISINNLIAPPLPARDLIDNSFWAVIALTIFILSVISAYRADRLQSGIETGTWSGFVSGALACCMALSLIIFGMDFIIHDPLNVTEWAARGTDSDAPTMAAYFAYETFAGALLHLTVLGVVMGGILGTLGGMLGKGIKIVGRLIQRS